MGCDIHFYVEKKVEGNWQPVKGPNRWYREFENETPLSLEGWAYGGRNYGLFTLLADVRNYGNGATPIAQPKGLPEDVSDVIKRTSERWGWDGHSHSHFTLSELLAVGQTEWDEVGSDFPENTLPKLQKLAQGDPGSVRVVFWFDN